jgi:hypothetical protein
MWGRSGGLTALSEPPRKTSPHPDAGGAASRGAAVGPRDQARRLPGDCPASGQPARSFLPNSGIPTDKSHARAADHHKYLTRAVPAYES